MADPTPRAVLFDLDDTLYDRTAAGRLQAETWVDRYLTPATPAERAESVAWLVALDNSGYGSKAEIRRGLQERCPSLDWDLETFALRYVRSLMEYTTLHPDVCPLLTSLRERQIPWGIVTNGSATQREKLVHLGLDGWTDCVFVSSEFGCKKPDRRIFDAATDCLGVPPAETLFVGDHCVLDIMGAAYAGMKTAWLSQGRVWPTDMSVTPDHVIGSLAEVGAIMFAGPGA